MESDLVWIGLASTAILITLLMFTTSWLVVLLTGLTPIVLLVLCVAWNAPDAPLPKPSQLVLPIALFILAIALDTRFSQIQSQNDIEFFNNWPGGWSLFWVFSLACGIAAGSVFRDAWGMLPIIVLYTFISMGIFFTACEMIDVKLDQKHPAAILTASIVDKRIIVARHSFGLFDLSVPQGSDAPTKYDVTLDMYNRFKVGDTFCFFYHAGALGIRWRISGACG